MRAQGATEYIFMVALGLVMILIAVSILHHPHTDNIKSASSSADLSSKQGMVEMIAQKYNSTEWWGTYGKDYANCMKGEESACDVIIDAYSSG
ncbi:MAG: hypothetical protein PWQ95_2142 [Thermococcaceae archaeon]|nr:hypothetical protein [Thermococcaceae archaeon]